MTPPDPPAPPALPAVPLRLPPAVPEVVAAAVESLSTRLRGRLDAAVTALTAADVTTTADGAVRIPCGNDALVTLTPDTTGTLTTPEQAYCTCLLAPKCLHRASVLSACPVAEAPAVNAVTAPEPRESGPAAAEDGPPPPAPEPAAAPVPPDRTRAAAELWAVAASVLSAGTANAGAVLRAGLLRAAHSARLAGLHRAETAALDLVRLLRAARAPGHAHDPAALVTALHELLLVTHLLRTCDPDPALTGPLRHHHRPTGPLRLHGVCREPVIRTDGLGGVVTHFVDAEGRWYSLRDVQPGGAARAVRSGTAHVALRTFLSDHFRLSRGGLILSGATVTADGRLLPEKGVRATVAAGRPWREWAGTAPGDLICCDVRILAGGEGTDLFAEALPFGRTPDPAPRTAETSPPVPPLRLLPAHGHPSLPHGANLHRLRAHPGLRVRIVGRVDPARVTTLRPVAVAPVPGTEATLRLPDTWQGRADLGYDLLEDDHFPRNLPAPPPPAEPPSATSPLWRMRRLVEVAAEGGRATTAEAAHGSDLRTQAAALRRDGLTTGAALLTTLATTAANRSRNLFGRLATSDPDTYAKHWLAAATYLTEAESTLARATLRGTPPE